MLQALAPLLLMKLLSRGEQTDEEKQFAADKERDTEMMDLAVHGSDLAREPISTDEVMADLGGETTEAKAALRTNEDANRVARSKQPNPQTVEDLADVAEPDNDSDDMEEITISANNKNRFGDYDPQRPPISFNPEMRQAFQSPPMTRPYFIENQLNPNMAARNFEGMMQLINGVSDTGKSVGKGLLSVLQSRSPKGNR